MTEPAFTPTNAAELLPFVELTGVRTYALAGRRHSIQQATGDVVPEIGIRLDEKELETRMRLVVQTVEAEIEADMAVVYTLLRPINMWSHVLSEFVARVAVMAVYPFVREAVFSTASRMGVDAPVLGLIRQNEFQVDTSGPELAASRVPASVATLAKEFGISSVDARAVVESLGIEAPRGRGKLDPDAVAAVRTSFITQSPG